MYVTVIVVVHGLDWFPCAMRCVMRQRAIFTMTKICCKTACEITCHSNRPAIAKERPLRVRSCQIGFEVSNTTVYG